MSRPLQSPLRAMLHGRAGGRLVLLAFFALCLHLLAQQSTLPKLTLAQVEQLVSHGVPDITMAAQIERRGVTFTPTSTVLDALQRKGAGPQTLAAITAAGSGGGNSGASIGVPGRPDKANTPPVALIVTGTVINKTASQLPREEQGKGAGAMDGGDDSGGGLYKVGGNVSPPKILYAPEAEFTDEARRTLSGKAYRGICVISVIVDTQGNPQNPRVISQALGMGLDENALEAVRKYKFKPAMKDGNIPVSVKIEVEINFRIY